MYLTALEGAPAGQLHATDCTKLIIMLTLGVPRDFAISRGPFREKSSCKTLWYRNSFCITGHLWPFHRSPVESPREGRVKRSFDVSLLLACTSCWTKCLVDALITLLWWFIGQILPFPSFSYHCKYFLCRNIYFTFLEKIKQAMQFAL